MSEEVGEGVFSVYMCSEWRKSAGVTRPVTCQGGRTVSFALNNMLGVRRVHMS